MKRYRVLWTHEHPMWGEVFAESEGEAAQKAKSQHFIPGTVDSDPGKNHWDHVEIKLLSDPSHLP